MRTALVTGANRGIGLAVAQSLAAAGLRVILGCRSLKDGEAAAAALAAKALRRVHSRLDVGDPASIDAALANWRAKDRDRRAREQRRRLSQRQWLAVPMVAVRQSMEVHFFGPFALCRGLVPGMVRTRLRPRRQRSSGLRRVQ